MTKESVEQPLPPDPATLLKNIYRQWVQAHQDYLANQLKAQNAYLAVCSRARCLLGRTGPAQMHAPFTAAGNKVFRDEGPGVQMAPEHTHSKEPETWSHPWTLPIESNPWVLDHRPTYTVPVLPLTFELDMMCQAAASRFPGKKMVQVMSSESRRWAAFDGAVLSGRTLVKAIDGDQAHVELQIRKGAGDKIRFETAAVCRIVFQEHPAEPGPESIPDLIGATDGEDPYKAGTLFHGPSLQLMTRRVLGHNGARCQVLAESRGVPYGMLHPGLLDGALHCLPLDCIESWYPDLGKGKIAFPLRMESFCIYGQFPHSGFVDVEARKDRIDHRYFPVIKFRLKKEGCLLAVFNLILTLLPEGPLKQRSPLLRKAFLMGERYVEEMALTRLGPCKSILSIHDAKAFDWLPGTLSTVYRLDSGSEIFFSQIAMAEHCARHLKLHPSRIIIDPATGRCANLPLNAFPIQSNREKTQVIVASSYPEDLDIAPAQQYWSDSIGAKINIIFDLLSALVKKFVRRVILEDPIQFKKLQGTPVLYLANHQTGIESLLFACLMGSLAKTAFCGIGNQEQQVGMFSVLKDLSNRFVDIPIPLRMLIFNQQDRKSLHALLDGYARVVHQTSESLYVAAEGRRAASAGHKVTRLSSVFIDFAIREDLAILPVRFVGGLPKKENPRLLDFPYDYGQQDYYIGQAIDPSQLHSFAYAERPRYLLDKINRLGPEFSREEPLGPDRHFNARVARCSAESGVSELGALLLESLRLLKNPCDETRELLDRMKSKPYYEGINKDSLLFALMPFLTMA